MPDLTTTDPDGWDAWRATAAAETAALAEANAAADPGDVDGEAWLLTINEKRPPLAMNYRLNRFEAATRTKVLRRQAGFLARSARIPKLERCSVQLIWVVPRADRRRDADNIVPTLKPICDGLVDAGVVSDDTPDFMAKPECIIEVRPGATAHLEVIVTRLPALDRGDGTPLAVVEDAIAPTRAGKGGRRLASAANLLDFEREHPGRPDSFTKAPLIREYFGITHPARYVDLLLAAAASREGLEHDAITAHAITDRAAVRSADRARRILGKGTSA